MEKEDQRVLGSERETEANRRSEGRRSERGSGREKRESDCRGTKRERQTLVEGGGKGGRGTVIRTRNTCRIINAP